MRQLCVIFITAALLLLTISRLALVAWQYQRVRQAGGLWPILRGGLRIDLHQIATLSVLPAILSFWVGHLAYATTLTARWFEGAWLLLVFTEVATPPFILEYDTRPNRLFVEYLKHPRELMGMLWHGFKIPLLGGGCALLLAGWVGHRLFGHIGPDTRLAGVIVPLLLSTLTLALGFLAIRGTLAHRPINPSTVAYSADGMINTLPLNSLYSVLYAIYSMKNEKSAAAVYGDLAQDIMQTTVLTCAKLPCPPLDARYPSMHDQSPTRPRTRPLHLVIILEESLGAQYVASLNSAGRQGHTLATGERGLSGDGRPLADGGHPLTAEGHPYASKENGVPAADHTLTGNPASACTPADPVLTPALEALLTQGWNFTRAYATGTRSVRGLEAVVTGFMPTPAQAVLKLPQAQQGFFTLAGLLGQHGYHSRFIYGGEAHFDNMKGFFLGNGFNEVVDRPQFIDPAFIGTWGASDEDMFNQLHRHLMADHQAESAQPTFTLAFTVSNHTPWQYPSGRISPAGNPATAENTIRYVDWALGRFFEQAQHSAYWQDTIFLVTADHDTRVVGANLVPVNHFHIPALILGGNIAPQRDSRIISQIDFAPTLLSLLGLHTHHPMLGRDLTQPFADGETGRAIMQYGDHYGYLKNEQLIVLSPHKTPLQYHYRPPHTYTPAPLDAALAQEALAHALWPSWAYRESRYTLPPQPTRAHPNEPSAQHAVPPEMPPQPARGTSDTSPQSTPGVP